MRRLPVTDHRLGVALHTLGFPLRTKVWRTEEDKPQLSAWIDHDVPAAAKLLGKLETGVLPREDARHPFLAALAGIHTLEALEQWLRAPGAVPRFTPLPPVLAFVTAEAAAPVANPLPLRTTEDLAMAAALIACGFLPASATLQNAGDGKHAALPLLSRSLTEPLLTRDIAATLTGEQCTHPFAYALYAARGWIRFRVQQDPAAAKEFSILLRGVGTRSAAVSRLLLDTTRATIDVRLPGGGIRRVKNQFRDQMRRHLLGFAS